MFIVADVAYRALHPNEHLLLTCSGHVAGLSVRGRHHF
jgi:hypothetical protein